MDYYPRPRVHSPHHTFFDMDYYPRPLGPLKEFYQFSKMVFGCR